MSRSSLRYRPMMGCVVAAMGMAWAGHGSAQVRPAVTSVLPVRGTVNSTCTSGSSGGRDITLITSVGKAGTLDPTLQDRTWTIPGWYCNAASMISVTATSLRLTPAGSSVKNGESQAVNYTARASGWTTTQAKVTTNDLTPLGTLSTYTGPVQRQTSPKTGTITIKADDFVIVGKTAKATPKLVQGSYSARIVVTLAPGL